MAGPIGRTRAVGALAGLAALASGCAFGARPTAPAIAQGAAAARPPLLQAPGPGGLVAGRVMVHAQDGFRPLAGAQVTAPDGGIVGSDAEGRYALTNVRPGPQTIRVTHSDFAPRDHAVVVIPGVGTPRAHVLLAPRPYGLRQAGRFDADVTGVVYDPRGAALGGAAVNLTCGQALGGRGAAVVTTADRDGFFAASLLNVSPDVAPPIVSFSASGTTPGGVPVRTMAVEQATLSGPRLVLNVQALQFPDVGMPDVVGATYVAPGATGEIVAGNLSARADEYHLELESGGETFEALPLSVAPGLASFRVPEALPDTLFAVRVVPFGRTPRRSNASPTFVTVYTPADLDRDVGFAPDSAISDVTEATNSINGGRFMAGDVARYTITLTNANPRVSPLLELVGRMPAGATGLAATAAGGAVALEGPDGAGLFRVGGLKVPAGGQLAVVVDFKSPVTAANGLSFGPTALALEMPMPGLTRPTAPGLPRPLVVAGVDQAAFTFGKVIEDNGVAADGRGQVVLTLRPVGTLAGAAFKVTDATKTEVASAATAARFAGTVDMRAAGAALGLSTNDVLDLKIDGNTAPQVKIFGPGYDAETLIGQINTTDGLAGKIKASRAGGIFVLERVDQGAGKTLEILATAPSAHLRAVLGLPTGLRKSGCQADFTSGTAVQPNGTRWSVTTSGVGWNGATGLTSATIVLRPPGVFQPGDEPSSPITFTYDVVKLNGTSAAFGGGTGAAAGSRTLSYNLLAPFTDTHADRPFTRTGPDAPAVDGF